MLLDKREQEIISRAQEDIDSFAPLYDYYFPKIYNYVYYRVRNAQLAEDLVSETFYKALANLSKYQWKNRSFGCWLYTIARNQIIDHSRRQEPVLIDEEKGELGISSDGNPEEKVLKDVTREELIEALKMLSPDQQDALLLRFQEGLRIKEIARVLNKNEGAVKALLFRGLKSLRKKLEGGEISEAVK